MPKNIGKVVIILLIGLSFELFYFNVASAATHPAGTNIISNGTIYMVTDNSTIRPYTSAGAFLSYGFNSWSNVQQATPEDLALSVGNFIPPRDGKIICSDRGSDKGTCYLMTNGMPAAFVSDSVFKSLGFSFSNDLTGDVSFLAHDSNISNPSEQHRPGMLISNNGALSLVTTNGLLSVPNSNVLASWGYSIGDAVPNNAADATLAQSGALATRQGAQLSPIAQTVNVIPNPVSTSPATVQDYLNSYPNLPTATTSSPQDTSLIMQLVQKVESIPSPTDDAMEIALVQETLDTVTHYGVGIDLADQFQTQKTELVPGSNFGQVYPYLSSQSQDMLNKFPDFKSLWQNPAVHLIGMNGWGSSLQIFAGGTTALLEEDNKQVETYSVEPYYWVFVKENGTWKIDLVGTQKYRQKMGQVANPSSPYIVGSGQSNFGISDARYTTNPKANDPGTWLMVRFANGGQTEIKQFHLSITINGKSIINEDEAYDIKSLQAVWLGVPVGADWPAGGYSAASYSTKITAGFNNMAGYPADYNFTLTTNLNL